MWRRGLRSSAAPSYAPAVSVIVMPPCHRGELRFSSAIIFAVLGPFSVRVAQRELAHYFRSLKAKTSHVLSHQLSQHFAPRSWRLGPNFEKSPKKQNAPKSLKNRSQRSMPRDMWPRWGVCVIDLPLIARNTPRIMGFARRRRENVRFSRP